jgi:hypothetical protein
MLRFLVCLMLMASPIQAQEARFTDDALKAQILKGPARFESFAAGIILGYGKGRGVDAEGVEAYLAVERTKIRVREMRSLMLADLDGDGLVRPAEIAVLMSGEGARGRGRLWQRYVAADRDGDGDVSFAEMRDQSQIVVAKELSARETEVVRSLMLMDQDQDGYVTTLELRAFLLVLAPQT